jgi:hypothetical protein
MTFDEWLDGALRRNEWDRLFLSENEINNMRYAWDSASALLIKDAARYRKLVSQAVEGDWGQHSGWRLQVDIKGAPSMDSIDDAIDAQFRLPVAHST